MVFVTTVMRPYALMRKCYQTLFVLYLVQFTISYNVYLCKNKSKPIGSYAWNRTALSPLDYQVSFCPMRCRGEVAVRPIDYRGMNEHCNLICVICYCQRPACEIYNICCPDISVPFLRFQTDNFLPSGFSHPNPNPILDYTRNSTPKLGCDILDGGSEAYLYIRSCLPDYTENTTLLDLCERDRDKHEETIETFTRVVDHSTNVTYKNMFCAICNNVENFTSLPTYMVSTSSLAILKARNRNELLQIQLMEGATYINIFPEGIAHFDCLTVKDQDPSVADECRVPSETNDVVEDIAMACRELSGYNYQVYDSESGILYKNIFCAICHKQSIPKDYSVCGCFGGEFAIWPLPFSILLEVTHALKLTPKLKKHVYTSRNSNCSNYEWPSPDGNCLAIFCSAGKRLYNSECTEAIEEIRGLGYRLSLWMIPLYSDDNNTDAVLIGLITQTDVLLSELTDQIYFNSLQSIKMKDDENIRIYWIEILIRAKLDLSRNQFETQILQRFINANLSIALECNQSLDIQTYIMNPSLETLKKGIQQFEQENHEQILDERYPSRVLNTPANISLRSYITISQVLLCQYVKFPVTKYETNIDYNFLPPNIRITLYLNVTQIHITELREFNMVEIDEDGGLNVCQDLLDSKLKDNTKDKDNSQHDLFNRKLKGTSLAEYIVSITCCVASIVCLLLTLLTYFLFPVLRTEAGINNMFLSCSLLLAQLSLLATAHIFRSSIMCTVIGITTHFLWLWMFSWSFICSFHMFRVFRSNTTSPTLRKSMVYHLKKIILSLVPSIAVTVVTIMYSYWTSAGQDIGYGSFSCYLNSTILIAVTVVAPLSLVTVINIVFFLMTAYKIYIVRRLQASFLHPDQQTCWYVYLRLSTVTGAFWTVTIAAAVMDNDILKLISITLNGLQGVTIFMSFICNKRVWYLYKDLVKHI